MRTSKLLLLPLAAGLAALPLLPTHAQKHGEVTAVHSPAKAVADMTSAARNFLASLDDAQKAEATFKLTDPERQNWKFTPVERKGITLQSLRPDQDYLALALLNSAMSPEGYAKALTIMSQERILWELENQAPKRNTEKYHILIFGEPSETGSWGWRFEGHHFSTSVTIAGGKLVSLTPTFMGTNPGEVKDGPRKGLRVLKDEEDIAIQLVNSLTDEQKKEAILPGAAPADILTGEKPKADRLTPEGIASSKLTEAQRLLLWNTLEEYIGRFRPDLSIPVATRLHDAGWDKLTFAWIGGTAPGEGKYYRIQSPDFLFEYDNTQNNGNHPHAVWRDFNGDFGADILAQHLKAVHGH
jgi:Protein of unknown function (DUF3500)